MADSNETKGYAVSENAAKHVFGLLEELQALRAQGEALEEYAMVLLAENANLRLALACARFVLSAYTTAPRAECRLVAAEYQQHQPAALCSTNKIH